MVKRIQRKRTKGWKMPFNTVYVGRPSLWGNPFKPTTVWTGKRITPKDTVELYKRWLSERDKMLAKDELKGRNLACWCPLDQPCHADILLMIANK